MPSGNATSRRLRSITEEIEEAVPVNSVPSRVNTQPTEKKEETVPVNSVPSSVNTQPTEKKEEAVPVKSVPSSVNTQPTEKKEEAVSANSVHLSVSKLYDSWMETGGDITKIINVVKLFRAESGRNLENETTEFIIGWANDFNKLTEIALCIAVTEQYRKEMRKKEGDDSVWRSSSEAKAYVVSLKHEGLLKILGFKLPRSSMENWFFSYAFKGYDRQDLIAAAEQQQEDEIKQKTAPGSQQEQNAPGSTYVTHLPWNKLDIYVQIILMLVLLYRIYCLGVYDENGVENYRSVDEAIVVLVYLLCLVWNFLMEGRNFVSYCSKLHGPQLHGLIPFFRRACFATIISEPVIAAEIMRLLWINDRPCYIVAYFSMALLFTYWNKIRLSIEKKIADRQKKHICGYFNTEEQYLYLPEVFEGLSEDIPEHVTLPFWHLCARTQATRAMFNVTIRRWKEFMKTVSECVICMGSVFLCMVVTMAVLKGITGWILWVQPLSGMMAHLVISCAIWGVMLFCCVFSVITETSIRKSMGLIACLLMILLLNKERLSVIKQDKTLSYLQTLGGTYALNGGKVIFKPEILSGNECYARFNPSTQVTTTNNPGILKELLKFHGSPNCTVTKCVSNTCKDQQIGNLFPEIDFYYNTSLDVSARMYPVSDYLNVCTAEYVLGKRTNARWDPHAVFQDTKEDVNLFTASLEKDMSTIVQNTAILALLYGASNVLGYEMIQKVGKMALETMWPEISSLPLDILSLLWH